MKTFIGIVVVVVTLAAAILWLSPPDAPKPQARSASSGGIVPGSKATDEKIAFISHGEKVYIEEHLKEGRFTVVEFTADW